MKKPTILITNDDGINALGLKMLISVMREFGRIVVVAPDKQQSGKSHSITVGEILRVEKIIEEENYVEYVTNGTPVDCVKLGKKVVLEGNPDLVVSGINHGSNATINVLYSGTMAAAMEACIAGIPAIGFSLDDYSSNADFSQVKEVIKKIVREVLDNSLPVGTCLNVNIPAVSSNQIKGIRVCRQGRGYWNENFDSRLDPTHKPYYWMKGEFVDTDEDTDTDYWALKNNYVSVV
ncbi:MAG: 5'/3'-nucleotidase SurE, partial [Bacteroidota bacterium]|nr:5'/3'-nucleotidase SurE [Bacteroidota bacterium]